MSVVNIAQMSMADARYGGQKIKRAKNKPHKPLLNGVKVYAVVFDDDICGCDSLTQAMDTYDANIDDFPDAYILECVASRKIWKRSPDEYQWESEYVK